MTYKKFLDNIENIYADQGNKLESEQRLRYGQIIMIELWDVWPQKYHQIAGSDKDPFYCDIIHKKPYDLLTELEKEWPVFPTLSEDKVRIQRLEEKLANLQAEKQKEIDRLIDTMAQANKEIQSCRQDNYNLKSRNIDLERVIQEQNVILDLAAGYISTSKRFSSTHPMDVKKWLMGGME